jgi:hypothetical protein
MQIQASAVRRTARTGRNIEGIEARHRKACASHDGRRCSCQPRYRAVVVIERCGAQRRRKSKTFPTARSPAVGPG